MFDFSQQRYPKTWKEMSVDYRLMFVYHGSMMALMMMGQGLLSLRQEILVTAMLVTVLASISMRHRAHSNWRWPGVSGKDVFYAIGTAVVIVFFLYSVTTPFSPTMPQIFPWYSAGAGIGIFGILSSLKLVYLSEAEFLLHCRTIDQYGQEIPLLSELPEPKLTEARWQKVTRGTYSVFFILLWIAGVLSFYVRGSAFKNGSPVPTATQTQPLTDHRNTVYVTPAEKQRIDLLQMVSWVGFPSLILGGFFLHFIVGVKLFPNAPTLAEYLRKKHPLT